MVKFNFPQALEKVRQAKALADAAMRHDLWIQVDGGVNLNNAKTLVEAGANVLVVGSAIFDGKATKENTEAFVELLRKA